MRHAGQPFTTGSISESQVRSADLFKMNR